MSDWLDVRWKFVTNSFGLWNRTNFLYVICFHRLNQCTGRAAGLMALNSLWLDIKDNFYNCICVSRTNSMWKVINSFGPWDRTNYIYVICFHRLNQCTGRAAELVTFNSLWLDINYDLFILGTWQNQLLRVNRCLRKFASYSTHHLWSWIFKSHFLDKFQVYKKNKDIIRKTIVNCTF